MPNILISLAALVFLLTTGCVTTRPGSFAPTKSVENSIDRRLDFLEVLPDLEKFGTFETARDGRLFLQTTNNAVYVWDLARSQYISKITAQVGSVTAASISGDGKVVVVSEFISGNAGRIFVYSSDGGQPISSFDVPKGEVPTQRGIRINDNGSLIWAQTDKNSYVFNRDGKAVNSIRLARRATFTPDNDLVVSPSTGTELRFYTAHSGYQTSKNLAKANKYDEGRAISPSGQHYASLEEVGRFERGEATRSLVVSAGNGDRLLRIRKIDGTILWQLKLPPNISDIDQQQISNDGSTYLGFLDDSRGWYKPIIATKNGYRVLQKTRDPSYGNWRLLDSGALYAMSDVGKQYRVMDSTSDTAIKTFGDNNSSGNFVVDSSKKLIYFSKAILDLKTGETISLADRLIPLGATEDGVQWAIRRLSKDEFSIGEVRPDGSFSSLTSVNGRANGLFDGLIDKPALYGKFVGYRSKRGYEVFDLDKGGTPHLLSRDAVFNLVSTPIITSKSKEVVYAMGVPSSKEERKRFGDEDICSLHSEGIGSGNEKKLPGNACVVLNASGDDYKVTLDLEERKWVKDEFKNDVVHYSSIYLTDGITDKTIAFNVALSRMFKLHKAGGGDLILSDKNRLLVWDLQREKLVVDEALPLKIIAANRINDRMILALDGGMIAVRNDTGNDWNYIKIGTAVIKVTPFDGDRIGLYGNSGDFTAIDIKKSFERVFSVFERGGETIVFTSDGKYIATPGARNVVQFRVENKLVAFERADVKNNHPGQVLGKIGYSNPALVAHYDEIYRRRIEKMGSGLLLESGTGRLLFETEPPLATRDQKIELLARVHSSGQAPSRFSLSINGVPTKTEGSGFKPKGNDWYEVKIPTPLISGNNVIRLSMHSDNGKTIASDQFETFNLLSDSGDTYVVAIGADKYKDKDLELKYAGKDAIDFSNMLSANSLNASGGKVHKLVITGKDVDAHIVKRVRKFLRPAKFGDRFILFLAGHGFVETDGKYYFATHAIDKNEPSKAGVAFNEFDALMGEISPNRKMMFMDTCFSGETDEELFSRKKVLISSVKEKQFSSRALKRREEQKSVPISVGVFFNDLREGTGAIVLASSSGREFSYEGDKFNNGVFTYAILNSLSSKADKNKDGAIDISEIAESVFSTVPRLTGGAQHPTFRNSNLYSTPKIVRAAP